MPKLLWQSGSAHAQWSMLLFYAQYVFKPCFAQFFHVFQPGSTLLYVSKPPVFLYKTWYICAAILYVMVVAWIEACVQG
jgi:hypothetical protein